MTNSASTAPAAPDAAQLVRQRRRTIVVLVAAALMGGLWWMGQPPVPVGEPDRKTTEQAAATPEPTGFQEWYAGGRMAVSGRIAGNAEPVVELLTLQPSRGAAEEMSVELQLFEGRWIDWREISQNDLKEAGLRYTAGSRGPRHVWELEYAVNDAARGVLTLGFGDTDLQSLSLGGGRNPIGGVEDAPARVRIDGQPVVLPMVKSRFVELFGEPSPPPERPRRGPPRPEGAESPVVPEADPNPSPASESPPP